MTKESKLDKIESTINHLADEVASISEKINYDASPMAILVRANEKLGEYRDVLEALESYASMQICEHENTHRGGVILEICDDCCAVWADDRGGKPEFRWPKEILAARALLEREK